MSENSNNENKTQEEIDIVVLLNYFEDKIKGLISIIGTVLRFLFNIVIYSIRAIFKYYKIIAVCLILSALIGYFVEKYKAPRYSAFMIVKPYFSTKYQLVTNISYYNALLKDENYETLSEIFDIDTEDVKQLKSFDISPGPETENERIVMYDNFIKSIDSVMGEGVSYEDFIENRDIYNGDLFSINVISMQKDIFQYLEDGFNRTFENDYSEKKMMKRDSMISLKKRNFQNSLKEIDSLKNIYLRVMEEESKRQSFGMSTGDGIIPIQEKTKTKEYDLLEKELAIKDSIRSLDQQRIEEDVFFDVVSNFQNLGNVEKDWTDRYMFIFPALTFIFLCVLYLIGQLHKFVENYEG